MTTSVPAPVSQTGTYKSAEYRVAGSTGTAYVVRVDVADGRIIDCSCPDATYRHRTCKHQRLVSQPDHGGLKVHLRYGPAAPAPRPAFLDLYS